MTLTRGSGVLLHVSSLPGPHGIGELGAEARAFVDFLAAAGQAWWQVLPVGPTGYGDSPYASFSAFAGNPLLIDLEGLVAAGWLAAADLAGAPGEAGAVDFGALVPWKTALLKKAHAAHAAAPRPEVAQAIATFRKRHAAWLEPYALFMAIKDHREGEWSAWEPALRDRESEALKAAAAELATEVDFHRFAQFVFFAQWDALRAYAKERQVGLIGDVPIFVAFHSADVWSHPELFLLDADRRPTAVAGVPPDYFSATGQLWGNPLYRWDAMAQEGYRWWIARTWIATELYDLVRVDHFRGFAANWAVPAGETTAVKGRWVRGPGAALFDAIGAALGKLPILAEDLGVITPDVEELRDRFHFPGMRILQFGWGGSPANVNRPYNYVRNSVAYTGTHDNDTTRGWWEKAAAGDREDLLAFLGTDGSDVVWDMIRATLASVSDLALIPMQDLLDLDSGSRMNTPGVGAGNWAWRMPATALSPALRDRLCALTRTYGRSTIPSGIPVEKPEPMVVHAS